MNKTRIARIASEIKKEVSMIINTELKDSRIAPITSITEVDLTDDLQACKIYVSVLGSDFEKSETIEGLKNSTGFIKRELGKRLNLRHIPDIKFILDEHLENALKLDKLIDDVIQKDKEAIDEREDS